MNWDDRQNLLSDIYLCKSVVVRQKVYYCHWHYLRIVKGSIPLIRQVLLIFPPEPLSASRLANMNCLNLCNEQNVQPLVKYILFLCSINVIKSNDNLFVKIFWWSIVDSTRCYCGSLSLFGIYIYNLYLPERITTFSEFVLLAEDTNILVNNKHQVLEGVAITHFTAFI